jgi:hypothetical protein
LATQRWQSDISPPDTALFQNFVLGFEPSQSNDCRRSLPVGCADATVVPTTASTTATQIPATREPFFAMVNPPTYDARRLPARPQ